MSKPKPKKIDVAAFELVKAKKLEESARAKRIQAEQALLDLLPPPEEGTKKDEGHFFKVTCTGKVTRKLDEAAWKKIASQFKDANGTSPVRTKLEIDTRGLKKLAVADPDLFRVACTAITAKPAKSSVKVEEIEEK